MHIKCNENDKTMMNEEDGFEISERDFYPPQDERVFSSGICDVPNGDAFYGYAEYFWEEYENHLFDCNN